MTVRPVLAGLILAAVLALTGCGTDPIEGSPNEQPTAMENVTTVCTPEGHRLFKYRAPNKGGLAVVPNDPTCQVKR